MEGGRTKMNSDPLILVAEDDDSNFKLIKAIIGKKNVIYEWAKNGEEMVQLFQQHQQRAKSNANGYQNAVDERAGGYEDYS